MLKNHIRTSFQQGYELLKDFLENDMNFDNITEVVETIINSLNKGGKVIICGNGGSMTDAM
nr:SIS domain-containing protein [Candidatus Delongbacteria bacterium]